ncbi:MAG: hypothetical protein RLZZ184_3164 [Cyanobacteriota bacterium]|jgi:hypothetical protein
MPAPQEFHDSTLYFIRSETAVFLWIQDWGDIEGRGELGNDEGFWRDFEDLENCFLGINCW